MSQINTTTITNGLLAAAVGAALLAIAAPASASTAIYLDKDEMFNPTTVDLSGPHYSNQHNVLAGPVLFTANYGATGSTSNTFQFLGFCVDIFDEIPVGVNSPNSLNDPYETGTLTDNGGSGQAFHSVSGTTLTNINKLITYGTGLWNTDTLTDPSHNISGTLVDQLAAVQGAIWEIENPGLNVDGSSSVDTLINQYESTSFLNGLSSGNMTFIEDAGGTPIHQSFAFITAPGGVPEPATWAMMILGLGGVGAALRRRRRTAGVACA